MAPSSSSFPCCRLSVGVLVHLLVASTNLLAANALDTVEDSSWTLSHAAYSTPWELGARSRRGLAAFEKLVLLRPSIDAVDSPAGTAPATTEDATDKNSAEASAAGTTRRETSTSDKNLQHNQRPEGAGICPRGDALHPFFLASKDYYRNATLTTVSGKTVDTAAEIYPFFALVLGLEDVVNVRKCGVKAASFLALVARSLKQFGGFDAAEGVLRVAERIAKAAYGKNGAFHFSYDWLAMHVGTASNPVGGESDGVPLETSNGESSSLSTPDLNTQPRPNESLPPRKLQIESELVHLLGLGLEVSAAGTEYYDPPKPPDGSLYNCYYERAETFRYGQVPRFKAISLYGDSGGPPLPPSGSEEKTPRIGEAHEAVGSGDSSTTAANDPDQQAFSDQAVLISALGKMDPAFADARLRLVLEQSTVGNNLRKAFIRFGNDLLLDSTVSNADVDDERGRTPGCLFSPAKFEKSQHRWGRATAELLHLVENTNAFNAGALQGQEVEPGTNNKNRAIPSLRSTWQRVEAVLGFVHDLRLRDNESHDFEDFALRGWGAVWFSVLEKLQKDFQEYQGLQLRSPDEGEQQLQSGKRKVESCGVQLERLLFDDASRTGSEERIRTNDDPPEQLFDQEMYSSWPATGRHPVDALYRAVAYCAQEGNDCLVPLEVSATVLAGGLGGFCPEGWTAAFLSFVEHVVTVVQEAEVRNLYLDVLELLSRNNDVGAKNNNNLHYDVNLLPLLQKLGQALAGRETTSKPEDHAVDLYKLLRDGLEEVSRQLQVVAEFHHESKMSVPFDAKEGPDFTRGPRTSAEAAASRNNLRGHSFPISRNLTADWRQDALRLRVNKLQKRSRNAMFSDAGDHVDSNGEVDKNESNTRDGLDQHLLLPVPALEKRLSRLRPKTTSPVYRTWARFDLPRLLQILLEQFSAFSARQLFASPWPILTYAGRLFRLLAETVPT
ncbi:unnamed protein product [Amoebophrya sp. A120]|nr:unnamed protein product [Amoebophrya sp. A120]|eukprot:GSA120T00023361001.1